MNGGESDRSRERARGESNCPPVIIPCVIDEVYMCMFMRMYIHAHARECIIVEWYIRAKGVYSNIARRWMLLVARSVLCVNEREVEMRGTRACARGYEGSILRRWGGFGWSKRSAVRDNSWRLMRLRPRFCIMIEVEWFMGFCKIFVLFFPDDFSKAGIYGYIYNYLLRK